MGKVYLLDSNVFIEAANNYYAFDICPGFWDWLDAVCPGGDVCSIRPVHDELARGSDDLASWAKARRDDGRFLAVDDKPTQQHYAQVVQAVNRGHQGPEAKSRFLAGADPWLVAKALTVGATVVTHEQPLAPNATRRISLANVCKQHAISYIDSFALLRKFGAQFHY